MRRVHVRLGAMLALQCGVAGLIPVGLLPALAQGRPRTLLAVFAHPDDEQVVSPMLARYAREGVRVHLVIATDGRKGVRQHAGIPAGEKLAEARAAEARCACEALKIEAPVLIGLEDGGLYSEPNKRALLQRVAQLIADVKPDVILTWGPDGVTGHTDHRMVSNVVTEVVQRGPAAGAPRLYYVGFSGERLAELRAQGSTPGGGVPADVAVVDSLYLPVRISYTDADARVAAEALACHKTQYTAEEVTAMIRLARFMENGAVRLRPWSIESPPVTDLFK